MKLDRSIRKPRLFLGLFLVLALALGITSMTSAAPQDGGDTHCYMTGETEAFWYSSLSYCNGGSGAIVFEKERCDGGTTWKQIDMYCIWS